MRPMPLICLPFAGSGASTFRTWTSLSDGELDVIAVQLPGREQLIDEEPHRDARKAIQALLPGILDRLGKRTEAALFGHSMGAVLACELAYQLSLIPGMTVSLLVASGSHSPWNMREERVSGLSDAEFLDSAHHFAGYRPPALEDPEFRALMLPVLRADAELHESYRPSADLLIPAPVLTIRGRDDAKVSAEEIGQWSPVSSYPLRSAELPGGHMYLAEAADQLVRLISDELSQLRGTG
ncbi:alpha/beta fold hydrolase [Streptomyces sp. NPDC048290]|uniref:thioesterase II family protein n=1 Tax=Streptomyces sp. NPDC048290 TaxID=3155811 RepID=UPI00342A87C3